MTFVPPSTAVKRNRAHNVDTDRLRARRAYLIVHLTDEDNRHDFAMRSYELQATVLIDRHAIPASERRTLVPRT